jgi:hypothetical protein
VAWSLCKIMSRLAQRACWCGKGAVCHGLQHVALARREAASLFLSFLQRHMGLAWPNLPRLVKCGEDLLWILPGRGTALTALFRQRVRALLTTWYLYSPQPYSLPFSPSAFLFLRRREEYNAKDRDAGARVSKLAVADTCQPHHRLIMRLLRRNVLSTVVCNTLDSIFTSVVLNRTLWLGSSNGGPSRALPAYMTYTTDCQPSTTRRLQARQESPG